jgi:hypothetical protein
MENVREYTTEKLAEILAVFCRTPILISKDLKNIGYIGSRKVEVKSSRLP